MTVLTRRGFNRLLGAAGAFSLFSPGMSFAAAGRVVVVGGGFGGATCAKYIKLYGPDVEVTLVEQNAKYFTCPFSNTVLGGFNDMDFITRDYDKLGKHGIKVVNDTVTDIDPAGKTVKTKGGKSLSYDRLVVSPGISFRWDQIDGYDAATSETIPHAWKAGPQTVLLRKQIEAMKDGGTVIISVPVSPFRAPGAPFERASLIAYYLKKKKPKSKVLILDSADDFEEIDLFKEGWDKLYPGMIEWVKSSRVDKVDAAAMTLFTASGESHKGDVINVIPPQKAGEIAQASGLADDGGWCPIDQRTFESAKHEGIHVIGDACIAGDMPKAGSSANNQGKACAAGIVSGFRGAATPDPAFISVFYSLISKKYAVSEVNVFKLVEGEIKKVPGAGGNSPLKASKNVRSKEAKYANGWYASITSDTFG